MENKKVLSADVREPKKYYIASLDKGGTDWAYYGDTGEFDTLAEAVDQMNDWVTLSKNEGWEETYRIWNRETGSLEKEVNTFKTDED